MYLCWDLFLNIGMLCLIVYLYRYGCSQLTQGIFRGRGHSTLYVQYMYTCMCRDRPPFCPDPCLRPPCFRAWPVPSTPLFMSEKNPTSWSSWLEKSHQYIIYCCQCLHLAYHCVCTHSHTQKNHTHRATLNIIVSQPLHVFAAQLIISTYTPSYVFCCRIYLTPRCV